MPDFKMNKEHALDLIIFWITGIDGDLHYDELQEVDDQLKKLNYNPTELHGRTMNHVSSLSSDKIEELINQAKQHIVKQFNAEEKNALLILVNKIINADDIVTEEEERSLKELNQLLK